MPLMMDNTDLGDTTMNDVDMQGASMMDTMDDLFGEVGEAGVGDSLDVHVPLQASLPLPPDLVQRIAEMQTSGACTKLAWSNTGSIARISSDGKKVSFHVYCEDRKTGAWGPTKESAYPIHAPEGSTFVHVQFSSHGQDLAVVDDVGLVYIYFAFSGLGRLAPASSELINDRAGRTELDGVVGMYWLPAPAEFKAPYMTPTTKTNDVWSTQTKPQNSTKVHHPMSGRSALLQVSRSGTLGMLYQGDSARWHSISQELDRLVAPSDMVTHASFCDSNNQILLTTHNHARQLRLFAISVEWNPTLQPTQTGPPAVARVAPTLSVGHVTSIEHAAAQHANTTRLSALTIIPPVPGYADVEYQSPTTVLATFTNAVLNENGQQNQMSFTNVARWHLEDVAPALHESFGKLKGNTNITPAQSNTKTLRRQPDTGTHKLVLSTQSIYRDTMVCLVASDGSTEFRERGQLNIIPPFGETAFVSSLPQTGFEHTPGDHNLHVAISADASCMALIRPDGKLDGKSMTLSQGWHPLEDGISDTRGMLEAAVVCVARQHIILTFGNISTAELTSLLPPDLDADLSKLFSREIVRSLTRSFDLVMMDENRKQASALKDSVIPRCLSGQLALGLHLTPSNPPAGTQLAWAVLNLKHIVYSIMSTSRPELLANPDAIASLHGVAKWSLDLFSSLLDALLSVSRAPSTPAHERFANHIASTHSPTLHLLLCSYPRVLLRFLAMYLPRLAGAARNVLPRARNLLDKTHLAATVALFEPSSLPFRFEHLNLLIAETDKAVQEAYAPHPERTRETELDMLTSASLPETIHPVLTHLLDATLPQITPAVNIPELYFRDTTWLALSPMAPQTIDAVRKVPIPVGVKVRRCRRCGSAMEDLGPEPERLRELVPWVQQAQRQCVCTCPWYLP